jgi:hypothetical protein
VFLYSVYGVGLSSDILLPELEQLAGVADGRQISINVRLIDPRTDDRVAARWFSKPIHSDRDDQTLWGKIDGGYLLRYPGLADFIVDRAGRELRCARVERVTSLETLRHLLLDRVLPLVLNLLGYEVLHATAVRAPAGICAFIGPAGAGKSTLAASFAAAGYDTFCDDCLVVGLNGEILCAPGYPGVRLWSDSLAAFGAQRVGHCNVTGYISKSRVVSNHRHFDNNRRPLVAIYHIVRPPAGGQMLGSARIERLAGRDAFLQLVSSSYVFDVTKPSTLVRHFRFIEELVARAPVARLMLPNDFTSLPAARSAILNELERP